MLTAGGSRVGSRLDQFLRRKEIQAPVGHGEGLGRGCVGRASNSTGSCALIGFCSSPLSSWVYAPLMSGGPGYEIHAPSP